MGPGPELLGYVTDGEVMCMDCVRQAVEEGQLGELEFHAPVYDDAEVYCYSSRCYVCSGVVEQANMCDDGCNGECENDDCECAIERCGECGDVIDDGSNYGGRCGPCADLLDEEAENAKEEV